MKSSSSRLLLTATGVAGLVLVSVAASGGTLAMWTPQAEVPGATVTAGNAEMSIAAPVGLDTTQLFPGQSVAAPFFVHNSGTVPLSPRVDTLAWANPGPLTDAVSAQVWADTDSDCAAPAGNIANPPAVTIAPGASQPMCLAVTLSPTAPDTTQGAVADLQLTLEGAQQR